MKRANELVALLFPSRKSAAVLGCASVLSGFAEAFILVCLAQSALAVSSGSAATDLEIGPLHLDLTTRSLVATALAVLAAKFALDFAAARLASQLVTEASVRWRKSMLASFLSATWAVQSAETEGSLQEFTTTHVNRALQATTAAADGMTSLFSFSALVGSALLVSPLASLTMVGVAGVLFLLLRPLSKLSSRLSRQQRDANLAYVRSVSEVAGMSKEIRAFGVKRNALARVQERTDAITQPFQRASFVKQLLPNLYQNTALVLVLGAVGVLVIVDAGDLGSLSAAILLLVRALLYTRALQTTFHAITEQLPFVSQLKDKRAWFSANIHQSGVLPLRDVDEIVWKRVSFSYAPDLPKALDDVSFTVKRGETIGVVGPSGAGKSTFVQLLLQLREPTSGEFLVDGEQASALDLEDWYSAVAYVPQEPRLFDDTVEENIRFFRPDLSATAIQTAATMAQIHDDIAGWVAGYQTPVGPRGGSLSGGQRQRVCLARALATEPSVLILDEPTSALDVHSEALVQESLQKLRGEVTLFVVAHRLSTLKICDRIMVFDNGRLIAFEEPDALRDLGGYFADALALTESQDG